MLYKRPRSQEAEKQIFLSTDINDGFAFQFRDTDPERFQHSISPFPNETANPDFEYVLTNLELQATWTAKRMARTQGDPATIQC
jgi:hypothetical protein